MQNQNLKTLKIKEGECLYFKNKNSDSSRSYVKFYIENDLYYSLFPNLKVSKEKKDIIDEETIMETEREIRLLHWNPEAGPTSSLIFYRSKVTGAQSSNYIVIESSNSSRLMTIFLHYNGRNDVLEVSSSVEVDSAQI